MGLLSEQTLLDFSETGLLSHARGFEFRPEQQQMAVAVAETLENEGALLAEAGTGVGKSLAYLIPAIRFALENGRKAVISTHTINLQEQLFHKDIPTVAKALNCHFDAALLKGRANYLCRTRLRRAMEQADDLFNQAETKQLYDLPAWSKDCGEGSLAELPQELNISPKVWAQVCSENHVCTPRNCGYDCPYQAARRRVQEAQVVVLNHTLFFGLLSIAAITSAISILQPAVAFIEEFWQLRRIQSVTIIALLLTVGSLIVVWFTGDGLIALDTLDFWLGTMSLYISSATFLIVFRFVWGTNKGLAELRRGARMPIPRFIAFVINWITPGIMLFIFVAWLYQNLFVQQSYHITNLLEGKIGAIVLALVMVLGFIGVAINIKKVVYIHPYYDVNGRTARTLSLWYLLQKKTYPFVIFNRGISLSKGEYKHNVKKSYRF